MRWIINYIRQCFCRHEWQREDVEGVAYDGFLWKGKGTKVFMLCSKCGYAVKHWKH